jgi:hypothetical protein
VGAERWLMVCGIERCLVFAFWCAVACDVAVFRCLNLSIARLGGLVLELVFSRFPLEAVLILSVARALWIILLFL